MHGRCSTRSCTSPAGARGLPKRFGNWHTIYTRNRWSKNGVLDRVFEHLPRPVDPHLEAVSLDSTVVKVHPDGTGAIGSPAAGGPPRFIGTFGSRPAKPTTARRAESSWPDDANLVMDRAYQGDETRQLALDLRVHTRGAAAQDSDGPVGVRPGDVQATLSVCSAG